MIRHIALWAMLAMLALLAGCGQKGPLYLPQADSQAAQQPAGNGAAAVDAKTSAAQAR